ncbi:hypothetical protein A1O1_00805 [Capronia coronata CBS 617.96]|uniref:Uncharacterized protein n=1 Tax=Capronia coronata CBS 617.96 TaxID=1182541 RepID=W9YRZ9_9EURO|nr:uncharacterized protein A1O1_00805 [Capronia coronata CBS 617.96]EXJ95682.1 hypothetical protein A1O1_00805 [Capronia coronata CBS 617.96]
MVDTRCANPELQLDVDQMILDYTLCHAIKAQFDLLTQDVEQIQHTAASESMHLLSIFDSFFRLFKLNHPSYSPSPEFNFNLEFLEFLVLLASRSPVVRSCLSDNMHGDLHRDTLAHLGDRRSWLIARESTARRLGKQPAFSNSNSNSISTSGSIDYLGLDVAREVEAQIYDAWDYTRDYDRSVFDELGSSALCQHNLKPCPPTDDLPLLFNLVPRFMQISARLVTAFDFDVPEVWMDIAGQIMLQAGVESLQLRCEHTGVGRGELDREGTETGTGSAACYLPRLEDCFAWGNLHLDLNNMSEADASLVDADWDLYNDLFRQPADPTRETPEWTQHRLHWLSEFSMAADASQPSQMCRLERLAQKYPLAEFQATLVQYLRWGWELTCDDDVWGKPVLVQIEEGHLKSLGVNGAEFDEFMIRVGLKKDVNPVNVERRRQALERNAIARYGEREIDACRRKYEKRRSLGRV